MYFVGLTIQFNSTISIIDLLDMIESGLAFIFGFLGIKYVLRLHDKEKRCVF